MEGLVCCLAPIKRRPQAPHPLLWDSPRHVTTRLAMHVAFTLCRQIQTGQRNSDLMLVWSTAICAKTIFESIEGMKDGEDGWTLISQSARDYLGLVLSITGPANRDK